VGIGFEDLLNQEDLKRVLPKGGRSLLLTKGNGPLNSQNLTG